MQDPLADVVIPDHPCPPARGGLEAWYDEALELEHLRFAPRPRIEPHWWRMATRYERRQKVRELYAEGYSFDSIAEMVDVEPLEVAVPLTREADYAPQVLAIERAYQADKGASARALARRVGCNNVVAWQVLTSLGVELSSVTNYKAGGGYKYTDAEYEALRHLREDKGMSWTQIGKRLGMPWGSAAMLYRRRYGKQKAAV